MLGQTHPTEGRSYGVAPWLPRFSGAERSVRQAGLYQERDWRSLDGIEPSLTEQASILASRWTDHSTSSRREQAPRPAGRYVISIALRPTRLRLARGPLTLFEGAMPAGMMHVAGPAQPLEAEFHGPCDFIHLHVAADYLRNRQAALAEPDRNLDGFMIRDPLAAQLGRTLTVGTDGGDCLYAESVGQTILMRLLAPQPSSPRVSALPKWRLRRVQQHVEVNIAERITLADLAASAGLSRMHFAAQFRAATGCRPHEYLLQQRIECAKVTLASGGMPLAEVALSVGFQTQSHFSTVFKQLTGETPARWQRANRDL